MSLVLKISSTCIAQYYYRKAGLNKKTGKLGAVPLIQRFGGSLNLNLHFHTLFLDGCNKLRELDKPEKFISVLPPSKEEIEKVLRKIMTRLIKVLVKIGVLASHYKYRKEILLKTKFNGTAPQPGTEEVTAADGEELPQKLEEGSVPRSKRYSVMTVAYSAYSKREK